MKNLAQVQSFMRERGIDAWLIYDFRASNAVLARVLPGKRWTTRRVYLWIPSSGEPEVLAHHIDASQFESGPVKTTRYLTWPEIRTWLAARTAGLTRVAMEYAPGCTLPVVSIADAGTVEMVRSLGVEVVSSADLIQYHVARWSAEAIANHAIAAGKTSQIMQDAFAKIRHHLASGAALNEYQMQQFILARFAEEGMEYNGEPICAVNGHSGDPHFEPTAAAASSPESQIKNGDWILIDLWARLPGEDNIFSDITWVGFAGSSVTGKHRAVFDAVKRARDASVKLAQTEWRARRKIQGWQLDDAARLEIIRSGFETGLRHRTGHSLSPGPLVHGYGVNLDNLETHDTREILPGLGWTVEPGIYGSDFGVRLELNMFCDAAKGPIITSCVQDEPVLV
ncbi:MAG: M24 family metallopeptidase [Planctomycetota bacterium]|nr:M24 family metallopeptidase [Planctomycetota bacterium]